MKKLFIIMGLSFLAFSVEAKQSVESVDTIKKKNNKRIY